MATGIINEEWRSIDGYINYQVSNIGRVRNADTGKILKPKIEDNGYYRIGLRKDGDRKFFSIHRLVAHEFIENPDGKHFVDHIDNNRANNCFNNLRWVFLKDNQGNRLKQQKPSHSKYKGVTWNKQQGPSGRWVAYIVMNSKRRHIGYFDNEEDAARAYNEAAKQYFKEYAKLNDV